MKDDEFTIEHVNYYSSLIDEKEKQLRTEKILLAMTALTVVLDFALVVLYRSNPFLRTLWGITCAIQCLSTGLRTSTVKEYKADINNLKEMMIKNPSLTKRIK